MNIAQRLKAERERLDLSQTVFGDLGGFGKSTVIAWERGTASPNAAFLACAAAAGVDVRYVITGSRDYAAPEPLSADERELLAQYRAASSELRRAAVRALGGGAGPVVGKQVFKRGVGQSITGAPGMTVQQVNHPKKGPRKGE